MDPNFLIVSSGGPNLIVNALLPNLFPPFFAEVDDITARESGPGVIARLTIEGNGAGIADAVYVGGFDDFASVSISMNKLLKSRVAVSKDVNGDTLISGPEEVFTCDRSATPTATATSAPEQPFTPTPSLEPTPTATGMASPAPRASGQRWTIFVAGRGATPGLTGNGR
ncbi:MAG TPA: hypothetical protein VJL07_03380 [Dehalococcoidia bacterium]|nr:hypothetical protein [Dehalococcoidia bacterium]